MAVYVVNAVSLGISEYTGLSFVDLADASGQTFGVAVDGLYEQTGSDDNSSGITCYVETGQMALGDVYAEKQVDRVWLTQQASGDCTVTLTKAYWDGAETLGPWTANAISTAQPHNRVVRGVLGEAGQYWQVKVSNVSGGTFNLRSIFLGVEQTHTLMGR